MELPADKREEEVFTKNHPRSKDYSLPAIRT